MAYDLDAIRIKVRRLTKSPSTDQISNADIDQYINDFYLYNLPETLQLLKLKDTLTFYTEPNRDTYTLSSLSALDEYLYFNPPVYIAGNEARYYQDKQSFYRLFPKTNNIEKIADGNGATTNFTGTLKYTSIIPGSITISAKMAGTNGHTYDDITVYDDGSGNLVGDVNPLGTNTINYDTGVYDVTFAVASVPAASTDINVEYVPYTASKPYAVLYDESQFILRPIPDQVYKVEIEGVKRPTTLAAGSPQLKEWWELLAYGAAKKILEDRLDMDTLAMIEPAFRKQEILANRRTVLQYSNQRSSTIYASQVDSSNDNVNNNNFL